MKNDSHIIGIIASILVMLLIFLILWFVYLDKPYVPEEEGIELVMADFDEEQYQVPASAGATVGSAAPSAAHEETAVEPAPQTTTTPSEPVVVQEDPSVAAAKAAREEAERLAAAEAAAKAEAEAAAKAKKAEEDAKKAKAQSAMKGLFGSGSGSGSGSSTTEGSGSNTSKGSNPVGSGISNGNSWSLNGRSLKGKLSTPQYTSNSEGIVVVRIRVNAAGQVVEATKGSGTNTSDQSLIDAAIMAAKKANFSSGNGDVIGTITYKFKLN